MLVVVLYGCSEEKHLRFKIENRSSSKIIINYSDVTQYGIPLFYNTTVYVHPGEERIMEDLVTKSGETFYSIDWSYSYDLYINSISNTMGDSVNFEPNVAHNWQFIQEDPNSYYILKIDSTSF
jgi:hypothetical protein